MGFQRKVFTIPYPTTTVLTPVLERRPSRISVDATLWFDDGGWYVLSGLWRYHKVWQGDWVAQEWFIGVAKQINGDYWGTMVNDGVLYSNGNDVFYPGVGAEGYFQGNIPSGYTSPMTFVVCESWQDSAALQHPKCPDGSDAVVMVDQMTNKVTQSCPKQKPFPIISIDATVQRLRRRGLLNV